MRYLQPVADYQQAGAVTDPTTGMIFAYLRFTDARAKPSPDHKGGLRRKPQWRPLPQQHGP